MIVKARLGKARQGKEDASNIVLRLDHCKISALNSFDIFNHNIIIPLVIMSRQAKINIL